MQPPCQLGCPPLPMGSSHWNSRLAPPLCGPPACSFKVYRPGLLNTPPSSTLSPPSVAIPSTPRSALTRRESASASCLADRDFYYLLLNELRASADTRCAVFNSPPLLSPPRDAPNARLSRRVVFTIRVVASRQHRQLYNIHLRLTPQSYHHSIVAH